MGDLLLEPKIMDKNTPWTAINKYLRSDHNTIDPDLATWLNSHSENKVMLNELLAIHELANDVPATINPDEDKAWKAINNRIKPAKPKHGYFNLFAKVAASIALLVIGFSISLLFKRQEDPPVFTKIFSPKGQKTQIFLPDSSHVYLNGGTSLMYSNDFLQNRKVELIGEAFFKVRKNDSPFTVHTDRIDVEVFGTEFNVKTFPEDPDVEISLLEGSIGLSENGQKLGMLTPDYVALMDKKSMEIKTRKDDVSKIISWARDELTFDDMTFEEIAIYLERWYGVNIEVEESLKKGHRYTFSVKTESLREMLNLINVITPIKYVINGSKVNILSKK